ncbi:gamma subclass chorismate mutase AroQ [Curtobacterium sp. VKM Ac-2922]|uniref:gamma subclass chorismate mutase AroQ n=1 Tax=Curtobacterium sp. VKM Ac-2922 TaxID=2929475 RepID=UPI001FB50E33|nr:gamma subclass chorismate mutase AroQ [Curtobacterium sp. VKM Ac-2922]MCJ1713635.1 gamma subclass chorismate mutase AroQ [Curtobacterium sp. VKM Ac-2922]
MTTTHTRLRRTGTVALGIGLLAAAAVVPTTAATAATTTMSTSATTGTNATTSSTTTTSTTTTGTTSASAQLDTVGSLLTRRLELADPVAQSKWLSGNPIADPVREQAVIDEAVQLAQQQGVDPALVTRVVQAQIDASKLVQRGRFVHWTHDPSSAPTTAPDLSTIRPQLDSIDTDLVAALGAVQAASQDPRCAHLVDAERQRQYPGLDSLQAKGVRVAWSTFCTRS